MDASTRAFAGDKELPTAPLDEIMNSQDKMKMKIAIVRKNCAFFGRSLSIGEKWEKGFEIAGIIIGTLLILPIPILAFTGSYKRLTRLSMELNKNISVQGKINDIANEVIKNEDKILMGKLKKFEDISDQSISGRITQSACDVVNGINLIEIYLAKGKEKQKMIGLIKYEFHYDASKADNERFSKKIIESEFNSKFFEDCTEEEKVYISRTINATDKDGQNAQFLNFTQTINTNEESQWGYLNQ